jgi:hypothetical protein
LSRDKFKFVGRAGIHVDVTSPTIEKKPIAHTPTIAPINIELKTIFILLDLSSHD